MNISTSQNKHVIFGSGAFKPCTKMQNFVSPTIPPVLPKSDFSVKPIIPEIPQITKTTQTHIQILENNVAPSHSPSLNSKIGKWTIKEHECFLKAMELYGNSWDLVRKFIGTRSSAQIRSHAQKYYKALRKQAILEIKKDPLSKNKVFAITKEYLNTGNVAGIKRKLPTEFDDKILLNRQQNTIDSQNSLSNLLENKQNLLEKSPKTQKFMITKIERNNEI